MTTVKLEPKRKTAQPTRPVFATKVPTREADTRAISKSVMERTKKARAYLAK